METLFATALLIWTFFALSATVIVGRMAIKLRSAPGIGLSAVLLLVSSMMIFATISILKGH